MTAGLPVDGDNFFGRDEEVADVWARLLGDAQTKGENLLMVSPRRVGKTSLVQHLADNPIKGWAAVFVDLQDQSSATDALAEIVKALKDQGPVGEAFESSFKKAIKDALGVLDDVELSPTKFRVKLREAATADWGAVKEAFETALKTATSGDQKLLIILDEFPILINEILESGNKTDADRLLRFFRKIRIDRNHRKVFRMIICGSIGLKPVLRQHKATADANDLRPFHLKGWSLPTAKLFFDKVAKDRGFDLPEKVREEILELTGDEPLPFHIQVLIDALKQTKKPAEQLGTSDVQRAFSDNLAEMDFDHYRERLDSVLEIDALEAAETILKTVAASEEDPVTRSELLSLGSNEQAAMDALRVLLEDGYLLERRDQPDQADMNVVVVFSNPMLLTFWRRMVARK